MLNSLSEKLVSYVSPSSDCGRADTDTVVEQVQSSVDYNNGGKHKRSEQPIDLDEYSPCVKKRKIEGGFVQKVTNSVAKMAEWLVHSTNYLFGRLDDKQLNLKAIEEEEEEEEEEENGQHLDEISEGIDNAEDDYQFPNLPNSNRTLTKEHLESEVNIGTVKVKRDFQIKSAPFPKSLSLRFPKSCNQKYLHRPPIHDRSKLFDNQETKQINGNSTAIHFLYSSKSQKVSLLSQPPLRNGSGGGANYMVNPGVRVNCSNAKNIGLSSNKLYSVSRPHKVRNDVCNVVQKPHMHTAAQYIRLEEKEQYRRLIQQFSRGDFTDQCSVHREEKVVNSVTSRSSSVEDQLSSLLEANKSDELKILKDVADEDLDKTSLTEMPTPKQKISFSDSESPDESQSEPEKSSENTSPKSSPRPSVRLKNNPYLAEEWVTELMKKYSSSMREQKRKIAEEQMKIKIFEEKRKFQEEKLNEEIQRRLQLSKKEIEIEEPPLLPEITPAMKIEIDAALKSHPSDEVLVEGFRIQIKRQDMSTLSGLNWLNDEVINFYMSMLMERSQKNKLPKIHSFNTFFYPKLQSTGYDGVRRWTRKVDIFAVKYLIIPVHLGMHWCLAVVNFAEKTICYYDSMGGKNFQCLETIKKYLCDESLDKKKTPFNLVGWTTKMARVVPHQMNGGDCGMFACKYADYITREIPISFTQADMPQFRRLMVYEILKKKLLT